MRSNIYTGRCGGWWFLYLCIFGQQVGVSVCKCCPTFPPSDFGASAAHSTWCGPCGPDLWLKSSAPLHWEAGWQRSEEYGEGHSSIRQTEENIYENSVTKSGSFGRYDSVFNEKAILQSEGEIKVKIVSSELTAHPVYLSLLEAKVSDQSMLSLAAKDKAWCFCSWLFHCQSLDLCFVVSQIGWVVLQQRQRRENKGA